ncbi:MAG: transposase, partial [Methylococcales bacterium]|nr:transposase [Methylococcales bacterium]
PNIFQSGSSVNKKTKIGKSGNRYVREALYMSALNASYRNPNVNAYYLRNGNYFF